LLFFLAIAEMKGFQVERYVDNATGHLERGEDGVVAVTRIQLQPVVGFAGDRQPNDTDLERMHEAAHKNCFISNSLKSKVVVRGHMA
jgi:organic hydroperoxide reductase OsmC/OhrA